MLCGKKLIRGKKVISCYANHCKDKNGPRFKVSGDCTPHNIDRMFQGRMIYCYTCGEELYKDDTLIRCIDGCESLVTFNVLEGKKNLTIPDNRLSLTSHESEAKPEASSRTKVKETSLTKPKSCSTTDTMVPLAPPATMQKSKPEYHLRTKLIESSKIQADAEPPAKPETKRKQARSKASETDIEHSYANKTKPIQSSVDKERTKQNDPSNRQNAKSLDKMPHRTASKSNVHGLKEVTSDPLSSENISTKIDSGGEDSFASKLHL